MESIKLTFVSLMSKSMYLRYLDVYVQPMQFQPLTISTYGVFKFLLFRSILNLANLY